MRHYRLTLRPTSEFATPMRGDTLFGQAAWTIRSLEGEGRLIRLLERYDEAPFAVFSDAFVSGFLPLPSVPLTMLGIPVEERKRFRSKRWIGIDDWKAADYSRALTDDEFPTALREVENLHNSLDYRSFRTNGETFAPYAVRAIRYDADALLDLYLAIDERQIDATEIRRVVETIGEWGYGKDATIGKGRFELVSMEERPTEISKEGVYMTLSPCVIDESSRLLHYRPFTRFGKHGSERAKGSNVFKRPLLMADTGAVLRSDRRDSIVGRAVRGVSLAHADTVHQGYAIVVAMKEV
ncbi:type III-A CRISPR-associated RAMP protein Csm4 [Nitratifractor sp.]